MDPISQELVIPEVLEVLNFRNVYLTCSVVLPNGTVCGSDLLGLKVAQPGKIHSPQ